MILKKDNVERVTENGAQISKLKAAGYKPLEATFQVKEEQKPLEKMKTDELKALAKEKKIEGAASLTKEELLLVLKDVV